MGLIIIDIVFTVHSSFGRNETQNSNCRLVSGKLGVRTFIQITNEKMLNTFPTLCVQMLSFLYKYMHAPGRNRVNEGMYSSKEM